MKINGVEYDVLLEESIEDIQKRGQDVLAHLLGRWGITRCFTITHPDWDGKSMPACESHNNGITRIEMAPDFFTRRKDLVASSIYDQLFARNTKGN